MADNVDKSVYGKKVFFLYPNYSFQSDIVERLRTLEYEVYIVNDYRNVKNILRKNPDSLLYVNIDNFFNAASWVKFLTTLEADENYSTCKMGIITDKNDKETLKKFEEETLHDAGIISLTKDSEENFRMIVKQLDSNNAKGRRQYVRANCLDDPTAEVFWITNNIMYKLKIIDISAVGIAVRIPVKQAGALRPGQVLKDINLMLKSRPMPINASVYVIKPGPIFNTAIFMIEKDTDKNALITIRTYVAETLQRKIEDQIFGMNTDHEDYTVHERKIKKDS